MRKQSKSRAQRKKRHGWDQKKLQTLIINMGNERFCFHKISQNNYF